MFKESHPRQVRAPIRNEEQSGRNQPTVAYPESAWIRCTRCGFTLNTARHGGGWGDGVVQTTTNTSTYDGGDEDSNAFDSMFDTPTSIKDTTFDGDGLTNVEPSSAGNGCPLCGTFMYL